MKHDIKRQSGKTLFSYEMNAIRLKQIGAKIYLSHILFIYFLMYILHYIILI